MHQSEAILYCLNETDSGILYQNIIENTEKTLIKPKIS